jgi:hypothetical protein
VTQSTFDAVVTSFSAERLLHAKVSLLGDD